MGEGIMIKIGVKIQYRPDVLDTQGRALLKLFENKKLNIKDCLYGKYIELHFDEKDETKALDMAKKVAKDILSNDLVETYKLEIIN